MIHDYFRVTGAHVTVLDFADLFSITLRNVDVQDFDTRWDEILLSMTKIPSDDLLESLYKLRIRESAQLKTVLELYDPGVEDDGEEMYSLRNFDYEIWMPETRKLRQEQWLRVAAD